MLSDLSSVVPKPSPFGKGIYSKNEELQILFLLKQIPFQKGDENYSTELTVLKVYQFPQIPKFWKDLGKITI